MTNPTLEKAARAAREEIVRQRSAAERDKCPTGAGYYDLYIAPDLIAAAVLNAALRDPSDEVVEASAEAAWATKSSIRWSDAPEIHRQRERTVSRACLRAAGVKITGHD